MEVVHQCQFLISDKHSEKYYFKAMELKPEHYETIMNLTRSEEDEKMLEEALHHYLDNPFINKLQVFSNQAVRIVDNARLRYLFVSESIFELSGYTKEEVMQGGLWFTYRRVHPIDMVKFGRVVLKVKNAWSDLSPEEKKTARFSFDARFKCKDGNYKQILQNCHALSISKTGKPYVLLFSSTDVTPYKKTEAMNFSFEVMQKGNFVKVLEGSLHSENMPLSPRELEVLRLTSQGHAEKVIGDLLFLSIQTVKTHRRNMLQKTQAKNSVELVRMGIANGWI